MTLTTHMAVHHARDNVRVNCIAPGMLYSSQMLEYFDKEPDMRERRRPRGATGNRRNPMGYRMGGFVPGERRGTLDKRRYFTGRWWIACRYTAIDAQLHELKDLYRHFTLDHSPAHDAPMATALARRRGAFMQTPITHNHWSVTTEQPLGRRHI